MSSEIYTHLYEELLAVGCLDVYTTNIFMKKNRPALKLSVIVKENLIDKAEKLIFKETTTFGIRKYEVSRCELQREFLYIKTKYGVGKVKKGFMDDIEKFIPEYDVTLSLAKKAGVSFLTVYNEILNNI